MLTAVYGTLREGGGLHRDYIAPHELLGTVKIKGFDMYSLSWYPYVVPGDGEILAEVYDLPVPQAYAIERMERAAGYGVVLIDTIYGKAQMFYMLPDRRIEGVPLVQDGDWIKYAKEKERSLHGQT